MPWSRAFDTRVWASRATREEVEMADETSIDDASEVRIRYIISCREKC